MGNTIVAMMKSRHLVPLSILALTCLSGFLPAQLSGKYTVNVSGSGSRNYKSFAAASFDLFMKGISAAVVFDAAPGKYSEAWVMYPTLGVSSTRTVTFRSPVPGAAKFGYPRAISVGVQIYPIGGVVPQWIVLDGFTFESGTSSSPGRGIFSRQQQRLTAVHVCAYHS